MPPGVYTTLELLDEIDSAIMEKMGGFDTWLEVELAGDGHINVNLEGGSYIDSVTGGLSYLLYEMYKGGGTGALLGTTIFTTDTDRLNIVAGKNDYMKFVIEDLKGNQTVKELTIPESSTPGGYTRDELIDQLNDLLQDTSVRATPYGRSIKLGSNKEFVTSFKGNMFSIDGPDYTSVFYDNVKSGDLTLYNAVFTGGAVLISDGTSPDTEHTVLTFDSTNNTLVLRPDKREDSVTITIPEGSYNLTQLVNTMQALFDAEDLGLRVTTWPQSVNVGSHYDNLSANYVSTSSTTFYGLIITTDSKGPDSAVCIDRSSSAYNTLFTDRKYIYYGSQATTDEDVEGDADASFTGSKDLSEVSATTPFALTDSNNSFTISVKGTDSSVTRTETITLDASKTYASADDIVTEIQNRLIEKNLDSLVKIQLSANNTLQFVEADNGDVDGNITISAAAGSGATEATNGYRMLFVGRHVTYEPKTASTSNGVLTFDTPGAATGNSLNIVVKGRTYTVDLSGVDKNDPAKIAEAINNRIQGETETHNYTFGTESKVGTTTNYNFSSYAVPGRTNVTAWSGSAKGESGRTEGATGGTPSKPAILTVGPLLKKDADGGMDLTSSNNRIQLTINKQTITLLLTEGHYTQETLRQELQNQINAHFGTGSNGASVTLSNDRLTITSNLAGADSEVTCGTNSSTFLSWLNSTYTTASCTSTYTSTGASNGRGKLADSIVITDNTNDKFVFSYRGANDTAATIYTLDLAAGTYDASGIAGQINTQLAAQGLGAKITASKNASGGLTLTTTDAGDGVSISFNTNDSAFTAADAMFGGLTTKNAAWVNTDRAIQEQITIESGKQKFKLMVDDTADGVSNAQPVEVTLTAKTYNSRKDFLAELNSKLDGKGVTASLVDGKLRFETVNAGAGTSVSVSYISPASDPASAMQAIYGVYTTTYPKIEASFDSNNKLTLTAKNANGTTATGTSISVNSRSSAGLLADTQKTEDIATSRTTGYHSRKKAVINGVSFLNNAFDGIDTANDTITIDTYNKTLSFDVYRNGNYTSAHSSFSLTLDERTYTYEELRQALQEKLNHSGIFGATDASGTCDLVVSVSDNGVKIQAKNYGNAYQFRNLKGGFYLEVLSAASEKTDSLNATDNPGYQVVNGAYTVGRKDVTQGAEIVSGISDEFAFDLTINGNTDTISMLLTPGLYDAQGLKQMLQSKIDEQLVAKGLQPGIVKVGIGGIHSGIAGSNDENALNLRIAPEVQAPETGEYLIDGVSGNAAFEIFYQTEGKIIPAYIMGAKDVSNGVTIREGKNDLTFDVDGTLYNIKLIPGEYSAAGIVNALNEAFGDDIPLMASINFRDGRVKISHTELGYHHIRSITGRAKKDVFFDENGGYENMHRNIQLSSETDDYITLHRSEFNSHMLRINSLTITNEKLAAKAVDRISTAINRVSALRINFGSMQNRLEHSINNNNNKEENLEAAESVIRDTDIASETVRLSTSNILEQSIYSILAQANQKNNTIIALLSK